MRVGRAKITWLLEKRSIPPVLIKEDRKRKSLAYTPIIVFEGQYNEPIWDHNISLVPLWSSIVFNEYIIGKESLATLTYLASNAPFEFLQVGAKFELFEGKKLVAIGKIVEKIE